MSGLSDEDVHRIAKAAVREALSQTMSLPREDASAIAAAAGRVAAQEMYTKMFAALGIDIADLKQLNRLRANLEFLNGLHKNTAAAAMKMVFVTVTIIGSALLAALWLGFKAMLHKP